MARALPLRLLERFRRGPETHSEWNLLLWRVTFPLVTLALCTLLAVAGQLLGLAAYSLLVCPVWYGCNLALGAYPFLLVFRFPELPAAAQWTLWRALAAVSAAVGALEWYMSAPRSKLSWILGNSLFGIVAVGALPKFFQLQRRVARSHYDALVQEADDEEESTGLDGSSEDEPEDWRLASNPGVEQVLLHQMDVYSPSSTPPATPKLLASPSFGQLGGDGMMLDGTPAFPASLGPRRRMTPDGSSTKAAHSKYAEVGASTESGRLVYVSQACAAAVWLVMFASYSSGDSGSALWFLLYALSPVLCIVLFWYRDRRRSTVFSFDHLVLYGTLVVHIPIFLGHFCVRLFAMAEGAGVDGGDGATDGTASSSWLQLGVSILYLLLMQGYFFMMTHVVNRMSEPFSHPSLLYIGQLYYYTFWYILVGSDTPIDALYWGMLLVSNVHIALLNTGVYTDFKQSSTGWLASLSHITAPMAMCLRASGTSMPRVIARCSRPGLSKLHEPFDVSRDPIGVEPDQDYRSDIDETIDFGDPSDARGEPSFRPWRSTTKSDEAQYLPSQIGKDTKEKPRSKSMASTVSQLSRSCSNLRRSSGLLTSDSSQGCCRNCDTAGSTATPMRSSSILSSSDLASSQAQLRPLYFLMKVAEQDNMADTTALILVPSLLTLLAVFDKPTHGFLVLQEQWNMWVRCVCMFIGRLGGSFLAREIFAFKLKSSLRSAASAAEELPETIDGLSARLWIQRLMLQDFHGQFWYMMAVTLVVTFACFDRVDLPLRFALLS